MAHLRTTMHLRTKAKRSNRRGGKVNRLRAPAKRLVVTTITFSCHF